MSIGKTEITHKIVTHTHKTRYIYTYIYMLRASPKLVWLQTVIPYIPTYINRLTWRTMKFCGLLTINKYWPFLGLPILHRMLNAPLCIWPLYYALIYGGQSMSTACAAALARGIGAFHWCRNRIVGKQQPTITNKKKESETHTFMVFKLMFLIG